MTALTGPADVAWARAGQPDSPPASPSSIVASQDGAVVTVTRSVDREAVGITVQCAAGEVSIVLSAADVLRLAAAMWMHGDLLTREIAAQYPTRGRPA